MREVWISDLVRSKLDDIEWYLLNRLQLSKEAALRRSARMRAFVAALSNAADYPKCRFKRWHKLGYRCVVFEKDWVFAYEVFAQGVIVRDMSHAAMLTESESD